MPLTEVDGVKIVERARARTATPVTGNKPVEVSTVDEILLENGDVKYICAYPNVDCEWVGVSTQSVVSHQVKHSPKREAVRLAKQIEEDKQRRSEATKRGRETRKANAEAAKAAENTNDKIPAQRESDEDVYNTGDAVLDRLMGLETLANNLHKGVQRMRMQWALGKYSAQPSVSEIELKELRDKAQAYDQLKNLLNDK